MDRGDDLEVKLENYQCVARIPGDCDPEWRTSVSLVSRMVVTHIVLTHELNQWYILGFIYVSLSCP